MVHVAWYALLVAPNDVHVMSHCMRVRRHGWYATQHTINQCISPPLPILLRYAGKLMIPKPGVHLRMTCLTTTQRSTQRLTKGVKMMVSIVTLGVIADMHHLQPLEDTVAYASNTQFAFPTVTCGQ